MTVTTPPTRPTPEPGRPTDPSATATGATLGRVLRGGVVASASLLVLGLLWGGATGDLGGGHAALEREVHGTARHPASLSAVVDGLAHGRPDALLTVGLLVLVATPIVRVVVAGFTFRRQGDRAFTVIAGLVLALLAVSFVLDLLS